MGAALGSLAAQEARAVNGADRENRRPLTVRGSGALTGAFLALVGAGLALFWWTAERQQDESRRLAQRWSAAEVRRLAQSATNRLLRAERVLRTLSSSPRMIGSNAEHLDRAHVMAAFLPGFESFSFVYAGLPDGSSYGAQRLLSGQIEVFTRAPGEPAALWRFEGPGSLAKRDEVDPVPFDPRETRWYGDARHAEDIVWSRPYAGIGAASIVTASFDAGRAVFGVDVSLAGVSRALTEDAGPTRRSSIFVLNREADPISGLQRSAQRGHERALDLFLRSGAGNLQQLDPETPLVQTFSSGGESFIGTIHPLRLSGGAMGGVALLTPVEDVSLPLRLTLLGGMGLALILLGTLLGAAAIASLAFNLRGAAGASDEEAERRRAGPEEAPAGEDGRAPMPSRVLICVRAADDQSIEAVAKRAREASLEITGEMPDRVLLRAGESSSCRALLDFALKRAEDDCAVGVAAEDAEGECRADALAERLASTRGAVNASERLADALGRHYGVRRRARFFVEGVGDVNVYQVEAGT